MSGHSKWKEIKRKGNPMAEILTPFKRTGFMSSNEYEVGQVIDFRARGAYGNYATDDRGLVFPEVPHVILSKECYSQYGSGPQWLYKVARLPDNPMTEEDMEDIST